MATATVNDTTLRDISPERHVAGVRASTAIRVLTAGIICAGIAFRAHQYLANRSLWLDESWLALNVVGRSFAQLFSPLDFHQAAPLGFLMISKLNTILFGNSELALRLFPLLAGIAALVLFFHLVLLVLHGRSIPFAIALFAAAGPLIYYASEFKQYSSDVAWALIIYLLAFRVHRSHYASAAILLYGLTGIVAVWCSHPSLFVLAGTSVCLAAGLAASRKFERFFFFSGACLLWLVSFATVYFRFLRLADRDGYLTHFWSHSFLPLPPRSIADLQWFITTFFKVFENPGGLLLPGLAAFLFLLGIFRFYRTTRIEGALLLGPLLLTLLAATLRMYPFAERLILFAAPVLYIFIAAGAEMLARPGLKGAWAAAAGLLLLQPVAEDVYHLVKPRVNVGDYKILEQTRPLITYMWQHELSGDGVAVYPHSVPAFSYYRQLARREQQPFIALEETNWAGYSRQLDQLRGQGRVWILLSHYQDWPEDQKFFRYYLDRIGKRVEQVETLGATLFLYEL